MGEWAWMSGSELYPSCIQSGCISPEGVYGTLGVPAAGNVPGGRRSAVSWTDSKGNLWLFGGHGADSVGYVGNLNDLWEFNPSTKLWTWMGGNSRLPFPDEEPGWPGVYGTKGVPSPTNYPGARQQALTWVDHNGNLWLFGGEGYGTVGRLTGNLFFNDLWVFNPSTNDWTWVAGSNTAGTSTSGEAGVYGTLGVPAAGNVPGSRMNAVGWVDKSGNLWLFGGQGEASTGSGGDLNDLWEFNPSTGLWAWMGGSESIQPGYGGQPGTYGAIGVAASANVPGGRQAAASWSDAAGNFWLFGGQGYDSTNDNSEGFLNDLWKFSPSTLEWTWMGGNSTLPCNDVCGWDGVYGTLNVPSATNKPGGRSRANSWTDSGGNLWLFGGSGFNASGPASALADLWKYNVSTNEWTWMGGRSLYAYCCLGSWPGIYGTLGTPAIGDVPGIRSMSASWTDSGGNLWLFGGHASDINNVIADANDLWEYQPGNASPQYASPPDFHPSAGTYSAPQAVNFTDATPNAAYYYTLDGSTPTTASYSYNGVLNVSSSDTVRAIAVVANYLNSSASSATYTINVPPPGFTLTASPSAITIQSGKSFTVTLTITPQGGFKSTVTFACSGLPAGASCLFGPSSVTPNGSAVTAFVTISTSGSAATTTGGGIWIPSGFMALAACFYVQKRNRAFRSLLMASCLSAMLQVVLACGGGAGNGPTRSATTSNVTVTGTSGSIQQTTTVSVTID